MNNRQHPDDVIFKLCSYIEGKTSREEGTFIEKQLKRSHEYKETYQYLLFNYSAIDNDIFRQCNNTKSRAKRIKRKINQSRFLQYRIALCIGFCFLLAGIILAYTSARFTREPPVHLPHKSITVTLADGSLIELPAAGKTPDKKNSVNALLHGFFPGRDISDRPDWAMLTVPKGKYYTIELEDGTIVYLEPDSRLRFPLSFANTREVFLDGTAYFEVSDDIKKPFMVHTARWNVRTENSRMNINTHNKQFSISLLSGLAKISNKEKNYNLQPGKSAIMNGMKHLDYRTFDPHIILSRIEGRYFFAETSLQEICLLLERIYDIEIKIDNPKTASIVFSGCIYRSNPLHFFLDCLKMAFPDIRYYFDQQGTLHLL